MDTWEKAFALFIGGVFLIVAIFLGIGLGVGTGNRALAVHTVMAEGRQCAPGLGDVDGFAIGELKGDLNAKTVEWDLVYDRMDQIIWARISGPVGGTSTRTGPVVLWLCGGDAEATCDLSVAHRLSGKATSASHGLIGTRSAITAIASRPGFYYLEIATTAYPQCAIRAQLGLTSAPGQWGW